MSVRSQLALAFGLGFVASDLFKIITLLALRRWGHVTGAIRADELP